MYVKIKTPDLRFSMPVPVSLIGFVVRMIPDRVFEELRAHTPEPYRCLVTKSQVGAILEECLDILRENKGLEAVRVEGGDGTFVSIKL